MLWSVGNEEINYNKEKMTDIQKLSIAYNTLIYYLAEPEISNFRRFDLINKLMLIGGDSFAYYFCMIPEDKQVDFMRYCKECGIDTNK